MGVAACIMLLLAATAGVAHATAGSATPAASRRVSFAGTAFASAPSENVDIVGDLPLVTRLSGSDQIGWTLDWHANVTNTTGTGQVTGARYQALGADGGTVLMPPGPPVRSALLEPSFTLFPPGPPTHPPSPTRLGVTVLFDETGQVAEVQINFDHGSIGTVD
jgi:hypothetical protein